MSQYPVNRILKNLFASLVGLFILACLLPATVLAWSGTVVTVADGDTITVAPSGDRKTPITVRLYGIDAPEAAQPYGRKATAYLRKALPVRTRVEIIPYDGDTYGRTVALVQVGGRTVNGELVAAGLAWVYAPYCKAKFCRQWNRAQKQAKADRRGLWADKKPTRPSDWRKMRKLDE